MSENRVHLLNGTEELVECARAARKRSCERLILVPVDFSTHSKAALLHASELAEDLPATLIVLHVVHDPGEMPGYYSKQIKKKRVGRIQDTAIEVYDAFIDDLIEASPEEPALQSAARVMVIGLPVTRILEIVDIIEPFMVVVGSQGRTGLKQALLGSKAAQLVQLCPVPVTVVKTRKSGDSQ